MYVSVSSGVPQGSLGALAVVPSVFGPMRAERSTLSVIVARSRISGYHRAYVRIGDVEAGYRDLDTGIVHSTDRYAATVAEATRTLARAS